MTCREARRIILAVVRREATDPERLRLDEHLSGCPRCLEERGRAALLERLRDGPRPTVSAATRQRILALAEVAEPSIQPGPDAARRLRWPVVLLPAAAALALAIGLGLRHRPASHGPDPTGGLSSFVPARSSSGSLVGTPSGTPVSAPAAVIEPLHPGAAPPTAEPSTRDPVPRAAPVARLIVADRAGEALLEGASVRYAGGSVVRIHDGQRRIDLLDGEVDVEVTPGGPGRFRVVAPRFIVEVIGTRFVVRGDGVRTLRGVVRVLDLDGRELSVVRAGQSWRAPVALAAPRTDGAVPLAEPAPPRSAPVVAGSTVPAAGPRIPEPSKLSGDDEPAAVAPGAAALLREARAALAEGDTSRTRARIAAALSAHPDARQRAALDLLAANALLADGESDRAVEAWRRIAARHADQPEAEMALFAAAQLLSERGSPAAARAALEEYARRYPAGHFVTEVKEKLARLPPP